MGRASVQTFKRHRGGALAACYQNVNGWGMEKFYFVVRLNFI